MAPRLRRLRLTRRASEAARAGHPWVFPDGFADPPPKLGAGDVVELLDPVGALLGRGLADGRDGWGPVVRVFSRDPRDPELRKLLFRRIGAANRLRERVVTPGTDGYRLCHGEGDDLPGLVVDRYGPVLVVRPDSGAWARHRGWVVEALRSEGPRGIGAILHRSKDGETDPWWGQEPDEPVVISEEGRRYAVRPGFGQKTGFFLDQRPNRTAVQQLTRPGDRALNLFSFTGGFSVAMAAAGGAVVSVDRAKSVMDDCRAQFPLNDLDPAGHDFLAEDIFRWLPSHRPKDPYDVVVCDPPALAHKADDVEAARKAYRRLHESLAPCLAPGGILVTCSCTARLHDEQLLQDAQAGLEAGGRRVRQLLAVGGAGPDHPRRPGFPEGHYLSVLTLVVD